MTVALGTLPWLLWTLTFIILEANGFRRANDRWPTLSQLVKWWERGLTQVHWASRPQPYIQVHGLIAWTWRRWLIALGLPLIAILLELHWVWETF